MEKQEKKSKKDLKPLLYTGRQVAGQAVLAAGTIAWIADHVQRLEGFMPYVLGGAVVALVLYWANKK